MEQREKEMEVHWQGAGHEGEIIMNRIAQVWNGEFMELRGITSMNAMIMHPKRLEVLI